MEKRIFIFLSVIFLLIGIANSIAINAVTGDAVTGAPIQQDTNVTITIVSGNTAPLLSSISNEILVCEGNSLSHNFNATDADGDNLTFDISPKDPFFVTSGTRVNATLFSSEIFSGNLDKNDSGGVNNGYKTYEETVSVNDGSFSDSKQTNITVIEINNKPVMANVNNQTITLSGGSGNLYLEFNVSDTEDGNRTSGNISFNITFLSGSAIFGISNNGVINTTLNSTHIGSYNIEVCATDSGIDNPHQNISLCGQNGLNSSDCKRFTLSISEETAAISSGIESGGIGAGGACLVKWACLDWNECQNADEGLASGELSGENYRAINSQCLENNWNDEFCGFQTRECKDVNNCNSLLNKPNEIQECYYTINPTCFDGIKNCHSGSCEFLVDCGGPCNACPTCSDNIKNQGEEGVDCGGACPNECPKLAPPAEVESKTLLYLSILFLFLVIIFLMFKIRRFMQKSKLHAIKTA